MKSYFKLLLFIFTSFLLLLSCEKEEHNHHHTEQSVIARNEKISNYPKLKSFLQNSNNLLGRNSTDYLELINNENISIITHDNGNKTYTFSLNIVETDKLTNLVVLESDEEYKLTLVEYSSSDIERWKEDLQNNQISTVEVNVTATSLNTTESICIVDGYTCPSGQHSSGQEQHCEFQFSTWSYFMYQVPCPDNGGTVGGGGGNPGNPNPTPEIPVHEPPFTEPNWPTLSPAIASFIMGLSPSQSVWWNSANPTVKNRIISYLMLNIRNEVVNSQALAFALELIDLARIEPNQADVPNLVSLTILIENSGDQLFTEQFEASLVQYTDLYQVYPQHEYPLMALTLKTFANYKKLREINSEWSRAKCIFYASKDIIHLGLDVFGLVPLVGEPADIVNGLLYTIEGDDLNATLSYASAVPVLGWASSTTKFGLKVVNIANDVNTKVKLVWKVGVNGLIEFGSSSQLRKVLNITSSSFQAHHIMPWAQRFNEVIQRAAKSGNAFHLNEALNGIAVATWRNQPNHNTYNNLVKSKLDNYLAEFPNATPQQCYNFVSNLVNDIRDWVISHPNSHLNDLVLP